MLPPIDLRCAAAPSWPWWAATARARAPGSRRCWACSRRCPAACAARAPQREERVRAADVRHRLAAAGARARAGAAGAGCPGGTSCGPSPRSEDRQAVEAALRDGRGAAPSPTGPTASCPRARSSAPCSRGCSPPRRTWCCWTSPPPPWTPWPSARRCSGWRSSRATAPRRGGGEPRPARGRRVRRPAALRGPGGAGRASWATRAPCSATPPSATSTVTTTAPAPPHRTSPWTRSWLRPSTWAQFLGRLRAVPRPHALRPHRRGRAGLPQRLRGAAAHGVRQRRGDAVGGPGRGAGLLRGDPPGPARGAHWWARRCCRCWPRCC